MYDLMHESYFHNIPQLKYLHLVPLAHTKGSLPSVDLKIFESAKKAWSTILVKEFKEYPLIAFNFSMFPKTSPTYPGYDMALGTVFIHRQFLTSSR